MGNLTHKIEYRKEHGKSFKTRMPNFILIDGSYYIFYRYFAILQWFKCSHKGAKPDNPSQDTEFVEKFRSTFLSKLEEIPQKLKIENPIMLVGKDCPREEIWRMQIFKEYKENRVYDDTFMGGPFFAMAYQDNLFGNGTGASILEYPQLEADDCIALTTKYILKQYPAANIWIITSDMDYLQLAQPNVHLYNLKYKKLTDSKSSYNDAKKDLFCKIVMGDKSDCIPSVFKKCGKVTAGRCYEDKQYFASKMAACGEAKQQFELNKTLIDFDEIPLNLVKKFYTQYGFEWGTLI